MLLPLGALFLGTMLLGMPIAFAMAASAVATLALFGNIPLSVVVQKVFAAGSSYPLLAIPLFVLTGELMTQAGMTAQLVRFCDSLVGHWRGGLAGVAILSCMVISGISGSGVADCAAIGTIMIPQLVGKGYPKGMASSIVGTGSALGPIIPPSILMVIYASIAEISVGALFLAGVLPGVMITAGLMAVAYAMNRRAGWDKAGRARASWGDVARATREATLPLLAPIIIIGGIVSGIFTATEAGVVGAAYGLLASWWFGRCSYPEIRAVFVRSALISTLSLFIISMASIFGWILAVENFPQAMRALLIRLGLGSPVLTTLYVLTFLVLLGFFVEVISMLIIFTPILAPMAPMLGLDAVHWGLLLVMAINMGGVTPPVAANLYVSSSIAKCHLDETSRYVFPLVAVLYAALVATIFVPGVATWLPRLVMR
ncbi:MAG: TRAP transporter large permease [Candidatus Methylomirabilales bacterium]